MANNIEDRKKALDAAISKLEKDFGKGTVMKLGDASANVAVETVPTGSLILRLVWEAFQRDVLLRFTDRSQVVRQQ